MHVKILILYQNFKALKIILFLLNFEVPLNVAFLKATQFVGTNFKDWRVQIEFDLDIMNVDLAIYEDKPAPLTYQSTEAGKLYHNTWKRSNHLAFKYLLDCYFFRHKGILAHN